MTDEAWLTALYQQHYALLYRLGSAFLGIGENRQDIIEEQIQEVFLLAWQKRARLRGHPNPGGWLVEAFRRCLQSRCRRQIREWKHRACSLDAESIPEPPNATPSPEAFVETREQLQLLERLLGARNADLFIRCCLYGASAAEAARHWSMSEGAVRVSVSRAKRTLLANQELFFAVAALLVTIWKGGAVG